MPRFDPNDYVDVQTRITRFWSEHPDGAIVTKLMSPPDDFAQCRYEAQVYRHRDDNRPSATGYAFELQGGSGPNATSHEENCETSAIGRALANLGYATSRADRPSQQEMRKVEAGERPVAAPASVPRRGPAPGGGVSWQDFWPWVKSVGFEDRASINQVIPQAVAVDDPAELKRIVETFLREAKQAS